MRAVRLSEFEEIMVQSNHRGSIFVKYSFAEEFEQITIIKNLYRVIVKYSVTSVFQTKNYTSTQQEN